MLITIIIAGVILIILERVIPDQKLPAVKGWWARVVLINLFQLGIIILATFTWDKWFQGWRVFNFIKLPDFAAGFLGYFTVTFVFYWWHRWRHDVNWFWLLFHQVHHSPTRIETITSFYKHPIEIIVNSLIIGTINYIFLGISLEASGWCLLYSSLAEYFYHMNIKTPHWIGIFFQRPEMHRIHHQRGKHYKNFSDFPLWDMCFGTYDNPPTYDGPCGFKPNREYELTKMLLFKNVNNPHPPKKSE
ncbi:MAG: sterol desaturase family protein [Elusimicrobiota bacterium]